MASRQEVQAGTNNLTVSEARQLPQQRLDRNRASFTDRKPCEKCWIMMSFETYSELTQIHTPDLHRRAATLARCIGDLMPSPDGHRRGTRGRVVLRGADHGVVGVAARQRGSHQRRDPAQPDPRPVAEHDHRGLADSGVDGRVLLLGAAAVAGFAKAWSRKAQKRREPNDRHYSIAFQRKLRRMRPEDLDRLLRDDED